MNKLLLLDPEVIYQASCDVINAGADFIKTSTGKHTAGATPQGAWAMLSAIKDCQNPNIGFKAAGGIKDISQALLYKAIASDLLGAQWPSPQRFRLGASQLLPTILATLS